MKRIFWLMLAIAALASCSNNSTSTTVEKSSADSTATAVDSIAADSISVDAAVDSLVNE